MFEEWAKHWRISQAAIDDYIKRLGESVAARNTDVSAQAVTESAVSQLVRLDADKHDVLLMRNNNGAYKDARGRWVRYGLANESTRQNKRIKSSDFVGIRRVVVTQDMVGSVIGQFVAREVKPALWKYTGSEHEKAQQRWHDLINQYGGDSQFCTGTGTFDPVAKEKPRYLQQDARLRQIIHTAVDLVEYSGCLTPVTFERLATECSLSERQVRRLVGTRQELMEKIITACMQARNLRVLATMFVAGEFKDMDKLPRDDVQAIVSLLHTNGIPRGLVA